MISRRTWIIGGIAGAALATTALSSLATQHIAARLGYHPALGQPVIGSLYQPFGWLTWQNAPWAAGVRPVFLLPNAVSGGIAAAFALGGIAASRRRGSRPKPFEDVHGSAQWATLTDIDAAGLLNNTTGLYVGAYEDPETGQIYYLRDTSGAHIAGIAPTRSGKGLGLVLPNLLSCLDSMFVYDPKGELWQLTAGWRKSIGQNVLRWQPGHPTASCGFNFLDEVRLGTEFEVADAQNIAVMLIDQEGKGMVNHWDRASFGFLTGVILHALYSARDKGITASLASVAALLSSPVIDPIDLCKAMALNKHLNGETHPAVAAAGVDQIKRDERERGNVLSSVKTYLSLFLDPVIARNIDHSSFRISDLVDHENPTSLYVVVTGADSVRLRPLVRLMATMVLNQLISAPVTFDANGRPLPRHRHRLVMMMDEFPDLKRLQIMESAMAVMSGAGVTAYLIMQDREQLMSPTAYGAHQTILANTHIISAYAPNEAKTADWLSHQLGTKTVNLEHLSESGKRGTRLSQISRYFSPMPRPLMTADEVKRLRAPVKDGSNIVEAGQMIILPTGKRPILGRQILYFEDPIFDTRSKLAPPAQSDNLLQTSRFELV
jgi:type IV secretion system protein VirD4